MMVPEETLRQYIDENLVGIRTAVSPDSAFRSKVHDSLVAGLEKLNHLSPNDTFWTNTNRRPTLAKLTDYFMPVLRAEPNDDEVRWILVAAELAWCPNCFASDLLLPLVHHEPQQLRWLVGAGEWVWGNSAYPVTYHLRSCLSELQRSGIDLESTLVQLESTDDPLAVRSASIARCIVEGGTIDRCIQRALV